MTSFIVDWTTLIGTIPVRRWRIVGVMLLHWRPKRLPVCSIDGWLPLLGVYGTTTTTLRLDGGSIAKMRIGSVSGYKSLRLRGDGREDAFLLETLAIGAATVV